MRDLGKCPAVALFKLLDHRHLVQHALSEFVDALRQRSDLIVASDGDLSCKVAALQDLDLLGDQMNILYFFADPDDNNGKKEQDGSNYLHCPGLVVHMIVGIKNNIRLHVSKPDLAGFLLFPLRFFHVVLLIIHIKNRAEYQVPVHEHFDIHLSFSAPSPEFFPAFRPQPVLFDISLQFAHDTFFDPGVAYSVDDEIADTITEEEKADRRDKSQRDQACKFPRDRSSIHLRTCSLSPIPCGYRPVSSDRPRSPSAAYGYGP